MKRVRALKPAVDSALAGLRAESRGLDAMQTQADELLPLKNKLDVLRKRVGEIRRAIMEILANDEDMAMMQVHMAVLGLRGPIFATLLYYLIVGGSCERPYLILSYVYVS